MILLISSNLNAQSLFQKYITGTPNSFQQLPNGEYIELTGASTNGNNGFSLIKYNSQGDTLWSKIYDTGGFIGIELNSNSLIQLRNGDFIIGCVWNDQPMLVKLNSVRNVIWKKIYRNNGFCGYRSLCLLRDSSIIISTQEASVEDAIGLIKVDVNGNIIWSKSIRIGPIGLNNTYSVYLEQTKDNGLIISSEAYLIKTDSAGNPTWVKRLSSFYLFEGASIVKQTSDSGFVITYCNFDVSIVKTDKNGNVLWSQAYGGPDFDCAYSIAETADGGYVVLGVSNSFSFSNGLYLIKLDRNGTVKWSKVYDAPLDGNSLGEIQVSADRGYLICAPIIFADQSNLFRGVTLRTDSLGNNNNCSMDTAYTQYYTLQGTYDTLIFPATVTNNTYFNNSSPSIIISRGCRIYNPCLVGIDDRFVVTFNVYPNPAADNLVIDCGNNYLKLNGYSIRITNIIGQMVYNRPITTQETNIQLNPPTWVNGTYVVQFIHPNGTVMDTKRIIIQ